jgi:hypothetical protein
MLNHNITVFSKKNEQYFLLALLLSQKLFHYFIRLSNDDFDKK